MGLLLVLIASVFSGLHHLEHDDFNEMADCSVCCILHHAEEQPSAVLVTSTPEATTVFVLAKLQPIVYTEFHSVGFLDYSLYNRPPPTFV
ncbi:MAG: hypothetical protein RQ756_02825 [Flavobacteriaceae bacterium]|nr:hypothetical protein [Flavobacteriaceae bacterium]